MMKRKRKEKKTTVKMREKVSKRRIKKRRRRRIKGEMLEPVEPVELVEPMQENRIIHNSDGLEVGSQVRGNKLILQLFL